MNIKPIIDTYEKEGYVHVKQLFSRSDLQPLITLIEQAVDAHANELYEAGTITSRFENDTFERRFAALYEGRACTLREWDKAIFSKTLYDLICHPALLEVLTPMLGPDITFNGDYHLRPKLPETEITAFPWHQDSNYYGEPTQHMDIITVTIPLVDLTEENGCLWFLPGSQNWGYIGGARGTDLNWRPAEDVEAKGIEAVPAPMEVGDIMPFHNLTFHCSKLNTTRNVRWTLDLRFSATPGTKPVSEQEQAAYDYMYPRLEKGFVIFPVQGKGGPTPWEQVEQRYKELKGIVPVK